MNEELKKLYTEAKPEAFNALDDYLFNPLGSTQEEDFREKSTLLALIVLGTDYLKTLRIKGSNAVLDVVYGGAYGNTGKNDGSRYRGRGFFPAQMIGKSRYEECARGLALWGFEKDAKMLAEYPDTLENNMELAAKVALWIVDATRTMKYVDAQNLMILNGMYGIGIKNMDKLKKTIVRIRDALYRQLKLESLQS